MQIFTVEYTEVGEDDVEYFGNCMEIQAPNLESAYEQVNEHYPHLIINGIFPS